LPILPFFLFVHLVFGGFFPPRNNTKMAIEKPLGSPNQLFIATQQLFNTVPSKAVGKRVFNTNLKIKNLFARC